MKKTIKQFFCATFLVASISSMGWAQGAGLDMFVNAEHFREEGKYKEALTAYDKALEKEPENLKYMTQKCQCLIETRDMPASIACFEAIIKAKPDHIDSFEAVGNLYALGKQYDKAVEAFEKACTLSNDDNLKLSHQLNIIQILIQANQLAKTAPYFQKAHSYSKNHFDVLYLESTYFNSVGQYDKALANMQEVMRQMGDVGKSEEFAKYFYEYGFSLYNLGKYKEAFEVLPKADFDIYKPLVKQMMPEFQLKLAEAYFGIFMYEKSEKFLEKVLAMQSTLEAAKLLKDKLSRAKSIDQDAIEKLNKAIAAEKSPIEAGKKHETLTYIHFNAGNYPIAITEAEECQKTQPKNFTIIFLESIAKYFTGEKENAAQMLEILSEVPGLPAETKAKCYFALGIIYRDGGNMKKSYTSFKKATFGELADPANYELRENKILMKGKQQGGGDAATSEEGTTSGDE